MSSSQEDKEKQKDKEWDDWVNKPRMDRDCVLTYKIQDSAITLHSKSHEEYMDEMMLQSPMFVAMQKKIECMEAQMQTMQATLDRLEAFFRK